MSTSANITQTVPVPTVTVQPLIVQQQPSTVPQCCECGQNRDNNIYIPGYGYITYCSAYCFRQTQ